MRKHTEHTEPTEPTEPTEHIEFDVPDDASELLPEEPGPYRTLLEIWRAVLEPAADGDMRKDPISPQWATKMVSTYRGGWPRRPRTRLPGRSRPSWSPTAG